MFLDFSSHIFLFINLQRILWSALPFSLFYRRGAVLWIWYEWCMPPKRYEIIWIWFMKQDWGVEICGMISNGDDHDTSRLCRKYIRYLEVKAMMRREEGKESSLRWAACLAAAAPKNCRLGIILSVDVWCGPPFQIDFVTFGPLLRHSRWWKWASWLHPHSPFPPCFML